MAINYTVNNIQITSWTVDTEDRKVTIIYSQMLDTGEAFTQNNYAIFWETIPTMPIDPETGLPYPTPDDWYQLPPAYSQFLTDLTIDAKTALMPTINE
jgi:hypothetical protein